MDLNKITKRLSRDTSYKPTTEKSYQSTLSDVDIAKKLIDYIRVKTDEIDKIKIGEHIRYFLVNPKTGKREFRMGGTLSKLGYNDEKLVYIICSNGTFSWSVQLSNCIIYKKLSTDELKKTVKESTIKEYKNEKADLIKENEELKKIANDNNTLKIMKENKELKKLLKEIKETTISAKNKNKNKN
jgi:hypothetical protein